jgi:16S rRNA (adenine1518-N6/adenine1519-N6)-dimethyltransferase
MSVKPRPRSRRPARKRFGQHFLEPGWVVKVVAAIAPHAEDVFLEIGPGRGALTDELTAKAQHVTAFEIDRDLSAELLRTAPDNLTVVTGDFLESRWLVDHPSAGPVRVVGNLPYNVASPILFRLVDLYERGVPIIDATVMLQREVADRLTAQPGSRDFGVLSILMQLSATVERVLALPAGAFRPVPKVQSALVRLHFHPPQPAPCDKAVLAPLVAAIFTRRRKTLENALLAYPALATAGRERIAAVLARAGLDGKRRPETLSLADFVRLADAVCGLSAAAGAVL